MAAFVAALIIGGVLAAGEAGLAYRQAQQQNRAARRSATIAGRNASIQGKAVNDRAALEQQKRLAESDRIRGLIRTRVGEAQGTGGSYDALLGTAAYDDGLNQAITEQNRAAQAAGVQSGAEAQLAEIGSHIQSTSLAALMGGFQGAQQGLSIAGSADSLKHGS